MSGERPFRTAFWTGIALVFSGCSLTLFGDSPADGTAGDDAGGAVDVPVDVPAETEADGEDVDGGTDGDAPGDAPEDSVPTCGNGVREGGEECDDGTLNDDETPDACRTNCLRAHCGDGVVDTGEGCDDGDDTNPDDGCDRCVPGTCGNGTREGDEECDDGNPDDTDACLHTCRNATCGDGYIRVDVEECDTPDPRSCITACGSTGTQACDSCHWAACAAPDESCNGTDDDCDTTTDEGYSCTQGQDVACTTTCGSTGTGQCTDACLPPEGAGCAPPAETCNGVDDDCNGSADESFDCRQGATVPCTTTCGSTGSGACTEACEIPPPGSCSAPAEVCNGVDDNCDTRVDEGFPCVRGTTVSCTTTCESTGTGTCTDSCGLPTGIACTPPGEACGNGRDDDCDTSTDEGSLCVPGTTVSCTTTCGSTGTGTCTTACQIPSPADCSPPAETCNGSDDDCVGGCDNGWPCCRDTAVPCTTTCGSIGTGTCTTSCAIPTGSACTPPAEVCNGVDDDCVDGCDNGFACCRGSTGGCTTSCGTAGSRVCSGSCTWGACSPPPEVCNGIDDDCDTACDEGIGCCAGEVRFCSHLCGSTPTAGTQACGPDCGGWLACTGECCDGLDNDSDTLTDEGVWCVLSPLPPVSVNFTDVHAISDRDVWVVGRDGTVLQWTGSGWTNRSDPSFTGQLNGVWGYVSGTRLVVVVGDRGVVRMWNGTSWATPTVSPPLSRDDNLYDVRGSSLTSVVAVGGRDDVLSDYATFVGYDGSEWTSGSILGNILYGVWGSSAGDIWAVGRGGEMWHWNGSRWSEGSSGTTNDLRAIYGTSSTSIRAVGTGGVQTTYSGSRWMASSVGVTSNNLYGYYARSATEAWAVGANGTIVKREGSVWKLYTPSPTSSHLYSVHGSGNYIFAVGASGTILRYRAP